MRRTTRTSTACATARTSPHERLRAHLRPRVAGWAARPVLGDGAHAFRNPVVRRQRVRSPTRRDPGRSRSTTSWASAPGDTRSCTSCSSGRATFTVNGDEIDAPAGTFVFVRDPAAKRKAVAEEAGTTIVVAGGKPGEAFTPSVWERQLGWARHFATRTTTRRPRSSRNSSTSRPATPASSTTLPAPRASWDARRTRSSTCASPIEADESYKKNAIEDPDFDAIRDDPEFSAITGQVDSARSSS